MRRESMADVGTITGIIGTITGALALLVSIKSYARVSAMKALDLRLELEKSFNNLDIVLSGIEGYVDFVYQSRLRVFSATGRNLSGEMKLFEEQFANDRTRLRRLLSSQPRRESSYVGRSTDELETLLTTVHGFHLRVSEIRRKYQLILESDDERRKEIWAEHQR
jgi:hypothetical protein